MFQLDPDCCELVLWNSKLFVEESFRPDPQFRTFELLSFVSVRVLTRLNKFNQSQWFLAQR